jgi:hypothetical protein
MPYQTRTQLNESSKPCQKTDFHEARDHIRLIRKRYADIKDDPERVDISEADTLGMFKKTH